MNSISEQKIQFGAYCNLKGRCVAFFRILKIADNHFLLRLNKTTVSKFLAQLKKYALFSKCTIADVSDRYHGFVIQGEYKNSIALEKPAGWSQWIAPKDVGIPADFEIIDDPNLWFYAEMSAGIPVLFAETQELFLPHHLNLVELGAVSFTKGCYLGQEIVARMQHLGKIKKHLSNIRSSINPAPGELLKDEQGHELGEVVCSVADPEGGYLVLAIISITEPRV